ncbi:MAG TPA: hypothetical protein VIU39_14410 [Anaerolineales bacterium]
MSGLAHHISRAGRGGGAQPGNANALKHGLYSRHISIRDGEEMEGMAHDSNQPELAIARTRLEACLKRVEETTTLAEFLSLDAAIQGWVEKIGNMVHRNAILGRDTRTAFVTILDYIRVNNDRQGVK